MIKTSKKIVMPHDHNQRHDRVSHRGFNFAPQLFGGFEVFGESVQNRVKLARRFAGLDHVRIDAHENFRMASQRLAQIAAARALRPRFDPARF